MPVTDLSRIFKAYDVRGIYGDDLDGDTAEAVGRGLARALADLSGKPTSELKVGLGRDMRLSAPEMAGRYRDGLVAEGAHVVDAGMVGTEMVYWLVGSRDLDGGLMCTASHNPKAYTGAKMVERGSVALSSDRGLNEIRAHIENGLGEAPGGGSYEEVDIYEDFQREALKVIDPGAIKALKVVVDGGNGMAGPMVGPILDRLPVELITTYWKPDGEFPDHEPNPLLPENREFVIRKVIETGADLGIAWDGDADRCFFIDGAGEFVPGDFLTALLAASILEKVPGADILYDVRASRAVPDTIDAARRARGGQPRRPRLLQDPHARRGRRVRRRGLRPLLLQGLLQRGFGHDPGVADARAALQARHDADRAAGRPALDVLHQRRDQLDRRRPAGQDGRAEDAPSPTRRSPSSTASRSTTRTGTSTCARRTPSRCCG